MAIKKEKQKIDIFFDNINPDDLIHLSIHKYGFKKLTKKEYYELKPKDYYKPNLFNF